jgi:hypothetical protein
MITLSREQTRNMVAKRATKRALTLAAPSTPCRQPRVHPRRNEAADLAVDDELLEIGFRPAIVDDELAKQREESMNTTGVGLGK